MYSAPALVSFFFCYLIFIVFLTSKERYGTGTVQWRNKLHWTYSCGTFLYHFYEWFSIIYTVFTRNLLPHLSGGLIMRISNYSLFAGSWPRVRFPWVEAGLGAAAKLPLLRQGISPGETARACRPPQHRQVGNNRNGLYDRSYLFLSSGKGSVLEKQRELAALLNTVS